MSAVPAPDEPGQARRGPGARTALAAATYTIVAAAQKASSFLLLIVFTRVLTPSEYGQVALLTTVGALLVMVLSVGIEPRIIYSYFRSGEGLADYLRVARRVTLGVPMVAAVLALCVIYATPIDNKLAWAMECVGTSLLAAGTTYAFAVLRSTQRVARYAILGLTILGTQVVTRLVLVAVLDLGPTGWAASDLAGGVVAVIVGAAVLRGLTPPRVPGAKKVTSWEVIRDGLPFVPHYLAHWGLSLSDRLVLALFVTTAALGVYSAIYQIAAVTGMVLLEVNRAFMPLYAQRTPGSPALARLARAHLTVSFIVHVVCVLVGFLAIAIVLPEEYSSRDELYPLLALGSLLYGIYFIPMNGLTLVAGVTTRAAAISVTAFVINLALNFSLDSIWGVWGAVVGTAAGYSALAALALGFELRTRAIPWATVLRDHSALALAYAGVIVLTMTASWPGFPRLCALVALVGLLVVLVTLALAERGRKRLRFIT
jgi:O-antigen/teichoic acid export membrane protein